MYVVYGAALWAHASWAAAGRGDDVYGGSPLGFAAFTTVSAFCNAGLMLGRAGAAPLAGSGALVALNLLVLHGNVLFPVLLRWVVALLSAASDKRSSRKVYFRFLLINGREVCTRPSRRPAVGDDAEAPSPSRRCTRTSSRASRRGCCCSSSWSS